MESTSGLSRNKGRMSLNSTWSLALPENPAEWYSISSRCQGEAMDVASCAAAHEVLKYRPKCLVRGFQRKRFRARHFGRYLTTSPVQSVHAPTRFMFCRG